MKALRTLACVFLVIVSSLVSLATPGSALPLDAQSAQSQPASSPTLVKSALKSAPLLFVENVGQLDSRARFQVSGIGGGTLWLAEDAIWLSLPERSTQPSAASKPDKPSPLTEKQASQNSPQKGVNLKLSFVGANAHPQIEPLDRQDTHVSYFRGNDRSKWRSDVPVWGGVRYKDLYPGIDLEVRGAGGAWTWQVVAKDGADPSVVKLKVSGADSLSLETAAAPHLLAKTSVGDFGLPLLGAVASTTGKAAQLEASPKVVGDEVSSPFVAAQASGSSAPAAAVASDLVYSTFLGLVDRNYYGIAVDGSGDAYVTGGTSSTDFPSTPGAFSTSLGGGEDAFVTKVNATGTALVYSTFLGGSQGDIGHAIALDSSGSAYVAGETSSTDFPTTPGALATSLGGSRDAFVAKLDATGSALLYSTYLGGGGSDVGLALALDGSGSAYVTGSADSSDFPTTPGAFDANFNAGDAFVTKLNSTGTQLVYSTFLGGSFGTDPRAIAVDPSGDAYVTGYTWVADFPTTPGSFDTSYNESSDAFVTRLNATGTDLLYSTFLGGGGYEFGTTIAVDSSGNAYVTGGTSSEDFPTTPGAFDTSYSGAGGPETFVTKLNATGSGLVYSTFLGGSLSSAIAVDGSGDAYLTGSAGVGFPTTSGAYDTTFSGPPAGSDAFFTKLNATGTDLLYSTFLGGSAYDNGNAIAIDPSGNTYVAGGTSSDNFPITPGAFDTTYVDGYIFSNAFAAKIYPRYVPVPTSQVNLLRKPVRLYDTRTDGQPIQPNPVRSRFVLAGYGGIPSNATAVLVNLTAVGYKGDGWLAAWPACTSWSGTSSLNFDPDENAIANSAIVKLGVASADPTCHGAIDVTASSSTHVVVDAVGYLMSTSEDQVKLLPSPQRLADTRQPGQGPALQKDVSRCLQVTGKVGVPSDATAVVLNLTAVGYKSDGWLAAYPSEPWSGNSSLNYDPQENAIANFAIVKLDSGGKLCLRSSDTTHAIVDVTGYLVSTSNDQIAFLPSPQRIVDTRQPGQGPALQKDVSRGFQVGGQGGVPADAKGVIANLTVVGNTRDGWIAAYPSEPWPGNSNVNYDPSENAIAGAAVVRLDSAGQLRLRSSETANAILDVSAYLTR